LDEGFSEGQADKERGDKARGDMARSKMTRGDKARGDMAISNYETSADFSDLLCVTVASLR
jgi:hypothetical protein